MATTKQVLILGAGFGGLASANLLRKNLTQEECQITVIDKNEHFMMGLVNLWILSGSRTLENSQVALNKLGAKGIKFLNDEITSIDPSKSSVTTKSNHDKLKYDYLIIASVAFRIMMKVVLMHMIPNKFHVYERNYFL